MHNFKNHYQLCRRPDHELMYRGKFASDNLLDDPDVGIDIYCMHW